MPTDRRQRKRRSAATKTPPPNAVPYKAVLDAAFDPIITLDHSGVIRSASGSVQRVFGWTPAELIGRHVGILMPEPHNAVHDGWLATYHRAAGSERLNRARQFEAVRKDGTRFPLEVSVSRVDVPERSAALYVGIARDLSEDSDVADNARLHELIAEQTSALQSAHLRLRMADRLASIGALAAGLGHDMNNVLLPVRAHLEAARTMAMIPEVRRHVDAVHKTVTYLQQLADGLHFLALDTDGEESELSATNLGVWWSQVGPLLTKAVPKHVKVSVSLADNLPDVRISAHGLTQAVLNLVVNAGEAIPADGTRRQGRVRVWAEAAKKGAYVRLGVSDNGHGMPAEVQRHALEMFYTTKPRGLGTGLGLSLVAKVAKHAGGSVQIESKPGKGTTVAILLPVAGIGGRAAQTSEAPLAVITLEDGRAAALVRQFLELSGARVAAGSDPTDADIWVLEPTKAGLSGAKVWRTLHPDGGLVLFGRAGSGSARGWNSLDPVTIEDRDDVNAIGAALGRAIIDL